METNKWGRTITFHYNLSKECYVSSFTGAPQIIAHLHNQSPRVKLQEVPLSLGPCSLLCHSSLVNTILVERFREVSITLTFREKFQSLSSLTKGLWSYANFLTNIIIAGKKIKFHSHLIWYGILISLMIVMKTNIFPNILDFWKMAWT